MGTKLPQVSGKEAVRAFEHAGFDVSRQRGSHIMMIRHKPQRTRLTIPSHKTIAKGTLRSIIRDAGLTVDEFVELLNS